MDKQQDFLETTKKQRKYMYNYEGESPKKAITIFMRIVFSKLDFFKLTFREHLITLLMIKLDKSFHKWVLELLVSNFCRLISKFTSGWLINDDTTREDSQIVKGSVQQIVLMSLSKF